MADSAAPSTSHLQGLLQDAKVAAALSGQAAHLHQLATTILYNLQHQHDWTDLFIHTASPVTGLPLPRPLISGLPPRRAYVHPDEQAAILKTEHETGKTVEQKPEQEWVLPTHLSENWSLKRFAEVFDPISTVPPSEDDTTDEDPNGPGEKWRGKNRQKRLLLATLHDDSTVVYYIVHDGLVKPRQN